MTVGCQLGLVDYDPPPPGLPPTPTLHLDAADASTLFSDAAGTTLSTGNNNVKRWNNVQDSSVYVLASPNDFTRPSADEVNNIPLVVSSGFNNAHTWNGTNPISGNSQCCLIWLRRTPLAPTRIGHPFLGNHFEPYDIGNAMYLQFGWDPRNNNGSFNAATTFGWSDNDFVVSVINCDGTTNTDYYADDFVTPNATLSKASTTNNWNTAALSYSFWGTTKNAEVIYYDRILSSSELKDVGNYINAKWGTSFTVV